MNEVNECEYQNSFLHGNANSLRRLLDLSSDIASQSTPKLSSMTSHTRNTFSFVSHYFSLSFTHIRISHTHTCNLTLPSPPHMFWHAHTLSIHLHTYSCSNTHAYTHIIPFLSYPHAGSRHEGMRSPSQILHVPHHKEGEDAIPFCGRTAA